MESIKMKLEIQKYGNGESLTIANTTYGVSQEGVKEIYDTIHSCITTEAHTAITNTSNLEQVLADNWSGSDRVVFVNNLKALGVKIENALEEYDLAIKTQFEQIIASWDEFQTNNVTER